MPVIEEVELYTFCTMFPQTIGRTPDILEKRIEPEPRSGKKLIGDLQDFYSIRLTYKDRIVYSIDEKHKIIYVHWTILFNRGAIRPAP